MTASIIRIQSIALIASALLGASELSDDDKERFLREANIVSSQKLSIGVTLSLRLDLAAQSFRHHAHFQNVDEYKRMISRPRITEANFRDSYRYNIAAYRLDRMLDLNLTPVSIERVYRGRKGALTWWVDDVLMMDLDRYKKGIEPPDPQSWNHQMHHVRLFNELVYNTDPNRGNVIIDKSWGVWLVDFTRAFRAHRKPRHVENLYGMIDRRVWNNLLTLNEETLKDRMDGVLLGGEQRGVLGRRDAIVRLMGERMAREGEAAVICDQPGH